MGKPCADSSKEIEIALDSVAVRPVPQLEIEVTRSGLDAGKETCHRFLFVPLSEPVATFKHSSQHLDGDISLTVSPPGEDRVRRYAEPFPDRDLQSEIDKGSRIVEQICLQGKDRSAQSRFKGRLSSKGAGLPVK